MLVHWVRALAALTGREFYSQDPHLLGNSQLPRSTASALHGTHTHARACACTCMHNHTLTRLHTHAHTKAHKCTQFKRIKQIFVRVITVPNNRFGSKERLPEGSHQINRALRTDLASGKSTASGSKSAPCRSFRARSGKVTDTMYSRRHCSVTPGCHYQHPQVGYQAVTPG